MKKTIKISVIVLIVILVVAFIAFFANSLFGNPISKKLAENTAIEYIEENYPDDNCQIKDIYIMISNMRIILCILSPQQMKTLIFL